MIILLKVQRNSISRLDGKMSFDSNGFDVITKPHILLFTFFLRQEWRFHNGHKLAEGAGQYILLQAMFVNSNSY